MWKEPSKGKQRWIENWLKSSYHKIKETGMKEDIAVLHGNVARYLRRLHLLSQSPGLYVSQGHASTGLVISN